MTIQMVPACRDVTAKSSIFKSKTYGHDYNQPSQARDAFSQCAREGAAGLGGGCGCDAVAQNT